MSIKAQNSSKSLKSDPSFLFRVFISDTLLVFYTGDKEKLSWQKISSGIVLIQGYGGSFLHPHTIQLQVKYLQNSIALKQVNPFQPPKCCSAADNALTSQLRGQTMSTLLSFFLKVQGWQGKPFLPHLKESSQLLLTVDKMPWPHK